MTVISFLRACYGTPGGHVRWLDEAKAIGEGHEASEDAEPHETSSTRDRGTHGLGRMRSVMEQGKRPVLNGPRVKSPDLAEEIRALRTLSVHRPQGPSVYGAPMK